jgi:hypothetical protein
MKRGRLNLLIMVWALGIGSLGCSVSFRVNQLEVPLALPPSSDPKPSIAVLVRGKSNIWVPAIPAERAVPWYVRDEWTERTLEAYRKSNLFSSVRRGFFEADLRAEVEVRESGEASRLNLFFSIFTLGVIPYHTGGALEMSTIFRDTEGEELATIQRLERLSRWEGLLLFPLAPFNGTTRVTADTLGDLSRSTLTSAGDLLAGSARQP